MPPHEQVPTTKKQISHVRSDLLLHGVHLGMPWAVFIVLTIFGNVLHLVSAHDPAFGRYLWLTTGLVVAAGAGTAAWDLLLRRHRMTGAGTVMLAAFLNAGYWPPLVLTWAIGGLAGCLAWDGWLHHAAAHELTLAFPASAEAAGLGKASLVVRERPRAPRRAGAAPVMRGSIVHSGGEVTQADVAARGANLEAAGRYPPGAFSATPSADDAAVTDFIVSDPRVLEHSDPWPGPHAPGADMSVPFRVGTWQTGEVALIPRLPLFHTRGMGMTGSAKTMGWGYNQLGEGVTRQDYAAIVIDTAKGEKFFGAWRPALHRFETDEERALYLLRALHRARRARSDYLGRKYLDQWAPGCGLSWLDLYLAEAPDVIGLLETAKNRMAGAVMSLDDWLSDVKNGRSAGMAWNLDLQLSLATELPTVAQGQMSHLCLGVESKKQAAFGLSARQIDATTCRPELWGKKMPGMAYWDCPTMPDEYATVPLRFFYWDGGIRQAFDYAAQWPSAGRPLDEVTGEALDAEPAPPASHALPGPGGTLAGSPPAGQPGARDLSRFRNVRPLFGKGSQPAGPSQDSGAEQAERTVIAHLAEKYARGETVFAFNDLTREGLWGGVGEGPGGKTNRARSWGYGALRSLTAMGYLEEAPGARQRWRILPAVQQQAQDEEG
jgi:hypothetical protein